MNILITRKLPHCGLKKENGITPSVFRKVHFKIFFIFCGDVSLSLSGT